VKEKKKARSRKVGLEMRERSCVCLLYGDWGFEKTGARPGSNGGVESFG